jgi:hypothetical protein
VFEALAEPNRRRSEPLREIGAWLASCRATWGHRLGAPEAQAQ